MTEQLTVTDLRQQLLEVIRRVEIDGDEVIVVRHGRRVARIVPERTPVAGLLGVDHGRVRVVDPSDDLLSTQEDWENA